MIIRGLGIAPREAFSVVDILRRGRLARGIQVAEETRLAIAQQDAVLGFEQRVTEARAAWFAASRDARLVLNRVTRLSRMAGSIENRNS